jgi:hypothetical protein
VPIGNTAYSEAFREKTELRHVVTRTETCLVESFTNVLRYYLARLLQGAKCWFEINGNVAPVYKTTSIRKTQTVLIRQSQSVKCAYSRCRSLECVSVPCSV